MNLSAHSAALTRPHGDYCEREGCPKALSPNRPHSARCRMLSWASKQGDLFPDIPPPAPLATGETKRDKALARVARRKFMDRALDVIRVLPAGEMTGEDVRLAVEAQGILPHHHNAWGALIAKALRKGLLRHTGRWEPAKDPAKHCHRNPVYRIGEA